MKKKVYTLNDHLKKTGQTFREWQIEKGLVGNYGSKWARYINSIRSQISNAEYQKQMAKVGTLS